MKTTFLTFAFLLFASNTFAAILNYDYTVGTGSIVPGTTDIGSHCDDCNTAITLPFAWSLYGTSYTSALAYDGGILQFGSSAIANNNFALPAPNFNDSIFVYWRDLDTSDLAGGQGIFTSISGVGSDRIFNIEWRTAFCCDTGVTNNFQIRLYEGQSRFDLIYGSTLSSGAGVTVGVQHDVTDYTQYQSNTAGTLSNGMMITFDTEPAAVPEPGSLILVGFGGCAVLLARRLRKRSS